MTKKEFLLGPYVPIFRCKNCGKVWSLSFDGPIEEPKTCPNCWKWTLDQEQQNYDTVELSLTDEELCDFLMEEFRTNCD